MPVANQKQDEDESIDREAIPPLPPTLLPKPVRLFSYMFFSAVLVMAVIGWFVAK